MAICMCLAGMPGLILGFFYAIHLKKDYSAATAAFGAILDYMMRQGLFSEMLGVAAACGGCAAIMSTIDSTTIAATNILTKEVVVNDLSRIWPQLVEPRIMTIIERGAFRRPCVVVHMSKPMMGRLFGIVFIFASVVNLIHLVRCE